jgi:hypothetical protein
MTVRAAMRVVLAIAPAFLVCACAGEVSRERIVGTYVMHPFGNTDNADTLRLRADGRYIRTFAPQAKASAVDSGAWLLSKDNRMVTLRDLPKRWAFVHDLMGDTTQGRVLLRPQSIGLAIGSNWKGTRTLEWYAFSGWTFKRIKSP